MSERPPISRSCAWLTRAYECVPVRQPSTTTKQGEVPSSPVVTGVSFRFGSGARGLHLRRWGTEPEGWGLPSLRPVRLLLEQLKDERGCLVGLGEDGDTRLLENLGTDKFAHGLGDVRVGHAAVGSRGVLGGNRQGTSDTLEA